MPLATGSRIGGYRIVAPLGAGAMGEVYRAHDEKLGRDIAIKILPESVAGDAVRLERFARELVPGSTLEDLLRQMDRLYLGHLPAR